MTNPKILVLDIETGPGKAYFWNLYDDFIPLERLIEPGRMLCFAAQFIGQKRVHFGAEWNGSRTKMLEQLTTLLNEADAVVTFNGDKFDLNKIRGEIVASNIEPFSPVTSIDLYRVVRKMGWASGKLEYVGPFLNIGKKKKHAGFKLWRDVLAGDVNAQKKMMLYNIQDIKLTAKLYKYLRPYMDNHPKLRASEHTCPNCGSHKMQKRGYRYSRTTKVERLQCQATSCRAWSRGKRSKI